MAMYAYLHIVLSELINNKRSREFEKSNLIYNFKLGGKLTGLNFPFDDTDDVFRFPQNVGSWCCQIDGHCPSVSGSKFVRDIQAPFPVIRNFFSFQQSGT